MARFLVNKLYINKKSAARAALFAQYKYDTLPAYGKVFQRHHQMLINAGCMFFISLFPPPDLECFYK